MVETIHLDSSIVLLIPQRKLFGYPVRSLHFNLDTSPKKTRSTDKPVQQRLKQTHDTSDHA